jgi:galactarate dehydratase
MNIILHENDNVYISLSENDTYGTKFAREDITCGAPIIKYGNSIGDGQKRIFSRILLSEHIILGEDYNAKFTKLTNDACKKIMVPEDLRTFLGYPSLSGQFGTRNYLAIHTSVQCVEGILKYAVDIIRDKILPEFPNVDGIVLLTHSYGCGVAIDAINSEIPKRTLVNLALNPNFGGYGLFVGLGCEKLRHRWMIKNLFTQADNEAFEYDSIYIQSIEEAGFRGIVDRLIELVSVSLKRL